MILYFVVFKVIQLLDIDIGNIIPYKYHFFPCIYLTNGVSSYIIAMVFSNMYCRVLCLQGEKKFTLCNRLRLVEEVYLS